MINQIKAIVKNKEIKNVDIKYIDGVWVSDDYDFGKDLLLEVELNQESTATFNITGFIKDKKKIKIDISSNQSEIESKLDVNIKLVLCDASVEISTLGRVGESVLNNYCNYNIEVLDIGDNSEVFAKPNLDLHSGKLESSHNLSIGRIDPKLLMYMMSRGIPEEEAERIMIKGFLG